MARITVEDCLTKIENRFDLVHVVAARAKQLLAGHSAMVKTKGEKPIVVSLREIAAGKVKLKPDQSDRDKK